MQRRCGTFGTDYCAADFAEDMFEIAMAARRWYEIARPDFPFARMTFFADNTHVHNLLEEEIKRLLKPWPAGPGLVRAQLMRAPTYSGDIMQCIEHVHPYICDEWWREMFEERCHDEDMYEAALSELFYNKVEPRFVQHTVNRLRVLLKYIKDKGTGDYADPQLV